jgi:hypothetical protein
VIRVPSMGDVTDRGVVVAAGVHQPDVGGGQLGVGSAGHVGGHPQRLT